MSNTPHPNAIDLHFNHGYWHIRFQAMASQCEVLLDSDDKLLAERISQIISKETWRIEQKFSRYRSDNILYEINHCNNHIIHVDEETALLLNFADKCYVMSGGMFDVSSGILRRAWHFDGSDRIAEQSEIDKLLPFVGWEKVRWRQPIISLPMGMELDFGGIGKEYAVDKAWQLLTEHTDVPALINFGGDLRVTGARQNGEAWQVGIEKPDSEGQASGILAISSGALATSGDSKRFLLKEGVRYSHILNPSTGWPITDAPRSVTVAAPTCIEAGMMATFASLQGEYAEQFLEAMDTPYWCLR
jgi:thiamine biosynthesis lipoprotein